MPYWHRAARRLVDPRQHGRRVVGITSITCVSDLHGSRNRWCHTFEIRTRVCGDRDDELRKRPRRCAETPDGRCGSHSRDVARLVAAAVEQTARPSGDRIDDLRRARSPGAEGTISSQGSHDHWSGK
ncbi:MAG: hypothetical protein ABS36_06690 [Acidobacteria bacterium SCN 69-37]|nr:MAG: hypothetical protein ABS36_06690 [Acidobacteria bacterium SCN 69-37]